MPVIEHWLLEVIVASGLPEQWQLGGSDNYTGALMDQLVLIAEEEIEPGYDYEGTNDRVLRMAEQACDALLNAPSQYDRRACREPHLYPSDYRDATIGSRTVRLMKFG